MVIVGRVPVFGPLLQLAPASDTHGREALRRRQQGVAPPFGFTEQVGGIRRIAEQVCKQLVVHRSAGNDREFPFSVYFRAVLGREGGGCHPITGDGIDRQEIEMETAGFAEDRIDPFQESPVAREEVEIPKILAEPGIAGGPDSVGGSVHCSGRAPDVGVVVEHPSAAAVHGRRIAAGSGGDFPDQPHERFARLAQAGDRHRPVVHLQVDVGGVFAVPGG